MQTNIAKLITTIKTEANTKDLTAFVFIGYFLLHTFKNELIHKGVQEKDMYKYIKLDVLARENSNYMRDLTFQGLLESIDYELYVWKSVSDSFHKRVLTNWNILGLQTLKKEFRKNKKGVERILQEFLNIDIDILSLMDIFEGLKATNKKVQDHFTPMRAANFSSTMLLNDDNILKSKEIITIYDLSCGIGRLFYPVLIELKEKYPTKTIKIFGMDLYEEYAVFTQSLYSLINLNDTHIFIGNSLFADPFQGFHFDIYVGNPPFGIKDYGIQTKMELLKFEDTINSYKRDHLSPSLKKIYDKAPLISKQKYLSIKNDFRAA